MTTSRSSPLDAVRTTWLQRIFLAGVSTAAALLLAELLLRAAGVGYPALSHPDDDRGWALTPGASGYSEAEGNAFLAINAAGMRDRAHSLAKPPGTLRIAVLGDSYAEGREVPLEQTFWSVLERELNQSVAGPDRPIEVLNFGVRGYSTVQELLTLRCCVWQYSPNVVLLALHLGNDVSDNSPSLDRTTTRYARPYLVHAPEGWAIDRSFRRDWRFRTAKFVAPLVATSRLLQLVVHGQHVILHRRSITRSAAAVADMDSELGVDSRLYPDARDPQWAEAWSTIDTLIAMIARESAQHGARFVVLCTTIPIQVYPDSTLRQRFARQVGAPDLLLPNRRIRAMGERGGFPVLDFTEELQSYADQHHRFLHGFPNTRPGSGHWNALGHLLAGQATARWMTDWIANPRAMVTAGVAPPGRQ